MSYYKEFPQIEVNTEYLQELTHQVISADLWQSIRRLKRLDNFDFTFSGIDAINDTDKSKRREYLQKVVFAYKMNDNERRLAAVSASASWLFKTNAYTRVYIHRESRGIALNFPILFEPGKSFVGFYNDDCEELSRHTLHRNTPVYYDVGTWHTVINESLTSPRIVMTCSELIGEWSTLVCE